MRFSKVLALELFLFLAPLEAVAQKTLVDLDTAPGNYSTWSVSDLKSTSVQFTATYAAFHQDEKWVPSYSIRLSDRDGNDLVFSGGFQRSEVARATTSVLKHDKEVASFGPILQMKLGQPYHVKLSWSGTTTIIEVDGVSKSYEIGFTPKAVAATSSTGELELKDIEFGN